MASPVDFKVILCQSAAVDGSVGTVHMLGAGWSVTGTPTSAQAVALLIKVPWDRANQQLHIKVELVTEDGELVELPGPAGTQAIVAEADLEVGRPPGVAAGTPLDSAMALNFMPMPLQPGRYQWRVDIAGTQQVESFAVRPT